MSRTGQSSPDLNLKKTCPGRLTTRFTPIFCNLADGKLGVVPPVCLKEFLVQSGLRTEVLREVGPPRVGGPCFDSVSGLKEFKMKSLFGLAMAFGVAFAMMPDTAEARSCCRQQRCCKPARTRCCHTQRQSCCAPAATCCATAAPCATGCSTGCSATAAPAAAAPAAAPQPPVENAPKPAA